ncbi:hypothetical protein LMF32_00980 [Desemzia sp. C1]|uniref:hypothetical protein n=1 Tax=Desemzia sp. C1 TaxID=2892016 RepID=UPI001E39A20C|nr:hypothetical protein [Desemzia sp. C1]MCI3027710.1 hypothetical protein [Desemzia sp. C1]
MKINFWPFHKHEYEMVRWRLVHHPHYEPSKIMLRLRCKSCEREINYFPKKERDVNWENKNRHLAGFWLGNEKVAERKKDTE